MTTRVVNIYRGVSFDVYIGRAGHGFDGYFGNPYRENGTLTREDVIAAFETYFYERLERDPEYKRRVLELKGKALGCFCKPKACHGDVIAAYLNSLDNEPTDALEGLRRRML